MDTLLYSRSPRLVLVAGILLLNFTSGCLPPFERPFQSDLRVSPWATALRALDPADTATPADDITAVYLHRDDENLQIRIDLLDFQSPNDLSLDIRVRDDSTPEATILDLHIPSEKDTARISFGPLLDTVIVEVPLSRIPFRPRVDVSTPEDEISGLTLDGPVPTQNASLLLTFYDTFAGRFPAEALRSWDGAHVGPRGERHGLKYLLDAARKFQVPVVLLDLKDPADLSALDAMGVLPQILHMQTSGLLILPQTSPDSPTFDLPLGPYWFEASPAKDAKYRFLFTDDTHHLHRWFEFSGGLVTSIPIATESEINQPTQNGPSIEVRRMLLETALNSDKNDVLVLGGSLANSTWGSPDRVGQTLAYFASRPYIQFLDTESLRTFPALSGKPGMEPFPRDDRMTELKNLYQSLTQPVLAFAENWKGSPISTCDSDIDKDGGPECILAGENYLAILDPQGARLTYLFIREGDILHQLIGPSWQVAVGLSDPSTWNLSTGEAADSGAYPGAFADVDGPFKAYEPAIQGNTLVFTSPDGTRAKTFKLTQAGIEVDYQTQQSVTTQIPLLVDSDRRFTPGWAQKYVQQNVPGGVTWGLENGPTVSIQFDYAALSQSKGAIILKAFSESLSLLANPEDPNFDYPPGHYVPFPMAVAEVEMGDGYFLRLGRLP
jgi:hypothetical protein